MWSESFQNVLNVKELSLLLSTCNPFPSRLVFVCFSSSNDPSLILIGLEFMLVALCTAFPTLVVCLFENLWFVNKPKMLTKASK